MICFIYDYIPHFQPGSYIVAQDSSLIYLGCGPLPTHGGSEFHHDSSRKQQVEKELNDRKIKTCTSYYVVQDATRTICNDRLIGHNELFLPLSRSLTVRSAWFQEQSLNGLYLVMVAGNCSTLSMMANRPDERKKPHTDEVNIRPFQVPIPRHWYSCWYMLIHPNCTGCQ